MSFLKIGDRAAGAIKSGGTTRRAAKMVVVDVDHPDIESLHRLEGEGGAEGRGARDRLQARQQAPQGHHEGLRELRGRGRRLLRSGEEPGSEEGDQDGAPGHDPGQLHQARHPVRHAGLHRDRLPDLRHRLGFGGLPHGLGPELQQLRLAHRRLPARRRERCATGTSPPARTARW